MKKQTITNNNLKTKIMKLFINLELQVKAILIAAVVFGTVFTTMILNHGFTQF